ncbi:hypothetical protein BH11PLA2_BH11PLA2_07780 [soil metagenome]
MNEVSPTGDPRVPLAEHRTKLASYRTQLALDRTTLAWIRTTLTMASFGFGVVAFFRTLRQNNPSEEAIRLHLGAVRLGTSLVLLGLIATVLASASHWFALRRLRRGESPVLRQWPLSITIGFFLVVICIGGLWTVLSP